MDEDAVIVGQSRSLEISFCLMKSYGICVNLVIEAFLQDDLPWSSVDL